MLEWCFNGDLMDFMVIDTINWWIHGKSWWYFKIFMEYVTRQSWYGCVWEWTPKWHFLMGGRWWSIKFEGSIFRSTQIAVIFNSSSLIYIHIFFWLPWFANLVAVPKHIYYTIANGTVACVAQILDTSQNSDSWPKKSPNLVGGIPTPLKNMSSSVGMIISLFPIYAKIYNVPNHQPDGI